MTDQSSGQAPDDARGDDARALVELTDDVLPTLIARLRASRLGEIEIRTGGWRVRLRREAAAPVQAGAAMAERITAEPGASEHGLSVARSPAVGYFSPGNEVAIGRTVSAGDSLGVVDMLGIVQEVPSPIDGVISRVLAESGQAVEYGQALVDVDPLGSDTAAVPD